MQFLYKVHEGFHISESTLVEEYCHCVKPENVSFAEVYYKNLSDEHNLAFEAIFKRNPNMSDAAHIDWEHLMKSGFVKWCANDWSTEQGADTDQ